VLAWLYLGGLDAVGLLGPDEPRYAAIAREMARSGDWMTPRLWGEPWFEKPPLTYWLMAAAFKAGVGEDLAPRLPIAAVSLAFLAFYYCVLRREFGATAAWVGVLLLGSCAGWLAFGRVGVTDMPMAAAFSTAMLLCLPWVARGESGGLTAAGILLGLAVLAKGLVPLVLSLPLLIAARGRWRAWLRPGPLLGFLLVAAPWQVAMSLSYGEPFWREFLLKHHVARIFTDQLQHVQPFWFYLPVLAAGLFPWTPLLALVIRKSLYADIRLRFLLGWGLFGLGFFSLARNKLPGYLLPLLPAWSALMAVAVAQARRARWALGACGLLVALVPVAIKVLPGALLMGVRSAEWGSSLSPWMLVGAGLGLWCWWWADRRRAWAVAAVLIAVTAGVAAMRWLTFPVLDRYVSVRAFWSAMKPEAARVCIERLDRERRYGLNYYSLRPLPDCSVSPRPLRLRERADHLLELTGG